MNKKVAERDQHVASSIEKECESTMGAFDKLNKVLYGRQPMRKSSEYLNENLLKIA